MSEDYFQDGARTPPPLPPPQAPSYPPRLVKNPVVATLLSVFPGLGHVYNGQPAKALVFFLAFVGSIAGAEHISPMPFAAMIPFVWFYNLIEAWRSAQLINARAAGGALLPEESGTESPIWGASLAGLGLLLLARNLGWIDFVSLSRYWPVLLIVAGLALLRGSLQGGANARP